jgi:uncharacterized protein YecE (DUF72 family)
VPGPWAQRTAHARDLWVTANIKTGITSWTEKSLVASGWYPRRAHDADSRLRFYATEFPIVENDSTYYALHDPSHARLWVDRTPEGFTMNVKAFASLTEHYTDPARLPKELRERLAAELRQRPRLYPHDLGAELVAEIAERFRDSIEPLRASGRLGVVLFQYPVWFTCSPENRAKLERLREIVPGCLPAVEFRNATWMNEWHAAETLALLRANDLVYTCVDEPQGFPASVPPVAEATSDVALVRFHGRARGTWMKAVAAARERFAYLYRDDELREWVPKVRRLSTEAREVHVLMNNCFGDYAVRNARTMRGLLLAPAGAELSLA